LHCTISLGHWQPWRTAIRRSRPDVPYPGNKKAGAPACFSVVRIKDRRKN
jgi:hypothetical protein